MRGHHDDIWCGAEDQLISGGFRSPLATVRTWPIDNAQEAANQVTPSGADQLYHGLCVFARKSTSTTSPLEDVFPGTWRTSGPFEAAPLRVARRPRSVPQKAENHLLPGIGIHELVFDVPYFRVVNAAFCLPRSSLSSRATAPGIAGVQRLICTGCGAETNRRTRHDGAAAMITQVTTL
jgi:hypothetical protein